MKALFIRRKKDFQKKQLKYLPYVFNDHFVLVLLFLTGYILFEYGKLLNNFPKDSAPVLIALALVVALLLPIGKPATYMEKADSYFLLAQEEAVVAHIRQSAVASYLQWTGVTVAILIVLLPLFLKVGFTLLGFLLLVGCFMAAKWFIQQRKLSTFFMGGSLDWDKIIAKEVDRKQSILKFYSLFTQVKGISNRFKDRKYLNFILTFVKKKSGNLWLNLYTRAFLRGADYLGIFVRLTLLSCLALIFISNPYLALALVSLFNYLLLFQLLALYHHFDYHYLGKLYPTSKRDKRSNLLTFLRGLSVIIWVIEVIFSPQLIILLGLAAGLLLFNLIYLPHKLKNIID